MAWVRVDTTWGSITSAASSINTTGHSTARSTRSMRDAHVMVMPITSTPRSASMSSMLYASCSCVHSRTRGGGESNAQMED